MQLQVPVTIFILLLSWLGHCESSPGSHVECQAAANLHSKPTDLGCQSTCKLLSTTPTITIY